MRSRSEPWASCPLKQEIRAGVWEPFIRSLTGGRPLQNYLTLYSPSLMDVKHLSDTSLIVFDGQVYKGVVGVTYDSTAYAEAIRQGMGRPEFLLLGNIINILINVREPNHKKLLDMFPFEAINLDYEDSIFSGNVSFPISQHIDALDRLFDMQYKKGCQKFCLFVTSRAEQSQFAPSFISELEKIIDQNLLIAPSFGQAFNQTYGVNAAADLLSSSYDDFATLGLIKLIISMLSDRDYEVTNCDVKWLNRDEKGGRERLLHLAFLIEKSARQSPQSATRVRQYGRRKLQYHARHLLNYLHNRATKGLNILKESVDRGTLQAKHGDNVMKLLSKTYQLKVPEQVPEQ
ncbi:hypothetical protein ES707_16482 [subsurface metagenome]